MKKERSKIVMLVEDDKINQKIIEGLLKKQGWETILSSDGEKAVEIYRTHELDMILMDLNLPKIDGFEATTRIRVLDRWRKRHTPIIGMTAGDLLKEKEKCLQVGMDGYITKPIETKKFYETIESIMGENNSGPYHIDLEEVLDKLDGDRELLKELIEDFIDAEYSINLVKDMKTAVADKDYTLLYKKAHKLKGAAASLNMNSIYEISYKLESKGKGQELEGVEKLIRDLEKEYEIIKKYFSTYKWEDEAP